MAVGQVACVFGAVLCVDRNVLILVYTGWRVWSIFDPPLVWPRLFTFRCCGTFMDVQVVLQF